MASSLFSFVPPPELVAFRAAYDAIAQSPGARVHGDKARDVLMKSGLTHDVLGRIWSLVDSTHSGSLSMAEFILAMFLASCARSSPNPISAVPAVLPPSVLQELSMANAQLSSLPQLPLRANISLLPATMDSLLLTDRTATVSSLSTGMTTTMPSAHASMPMLNPDMHAIIHPGMGRSISSSSIMLQATGSTGDVTGLGIQPNAMTIPGMMAGMGPPPMGDGGVVRWAISPAEKAKYDVMFKAWDTQGTGYLNGDRCREVFLGSGLHGNILQHIWSLADVHNNGKLNVDEFAVAMHLIYKKMNNVDLPTTLPPELLPPSHRTLDNSVKQMKEQLKHKLMTEKAYAAASPIRSNKGTGKSKTADDDDGGAYVSKHRRKPQSNTPSATNSATGSAVSLNESFSNSIHATSSTALAESDTSQRIAQLRQQIDVEKRKLTDGNVSTHNDFLTNITTDIENMKRDVKISYHAVQPLETRFKASVTEYNKCATSLRECLSQLDAQSATPLSHNTGNNSQDSASLLALKARIMQVESNIAISNLEKFKHRDAKSYKYAQLPYNLTTLTPSSDSSSTNLFSTISPATANSGTASFKPLTDDEKIKQRAAQMLAERMAALTGKPVAGIGSSNNATAVASLTSEQKEALSRINTERERLKELLKVKEKNIDDLLARLGVKSIATSTDFSSVLEVLDTDKRRLSTVQSQLETLHVQLSKSYNEVKHLIGDNVSTESFRSQPFSALKPATSSSQFDSLHISAQSPSYSALSKGKAFDYASLLSSPSKSIDTAILLGREPMFPEHTNRKPSNISPMSSRSSLQELDRSATTQPSFSKLKAPTTQSTERTSVPKKPDASSLDDSSNALDVNAMMNAAKEARLKAQQKEQNTQREQLEEQHRPLPKSTNKDRPWAATSVPLEIKPVASTQNNILANPFMGGGEKSETTATNTPVENVKPGVGSVKALAQSLFGAVSAPVNVNKVSVSKAADVPPLARQPSFEWLSTRSNEQVISPVHSSAGSSNTDDAWIRVDASGNSNYSSNKSPTSHMVVSQQLSQAPPKETQPDFFNNPFISAPGPFNTNDTTNPIQSKENNENIAKYSTTVGLFEPAVKYFSDKGASELFPKLEGPFSDHQSRPTQLNSFNVRALYDYSSGDKEDLNFTENTIISVDPMQTDGKWYYGMISTSHQSGWFPQSYVEPASTIATAPTTSANGVAGRALYDYTANDAEELTVHEGSTLTILDQSNQDWWRVMCNGLSGYVPASYVELAHMEAPTQISDDKMRPKLSSPVRIVPPPTEAEMLLMAPSGLRRIARSNSVSGSSAMAPLWASNINPNLLSAISAEERKRQEAIFELITTEQSYVQDLQLVMDVFIGPLQNQNMLSESETTDIFGKWEELLLANVTLLSEFESRQTQDDHYIRSIGDVFLNHGKVLQNYKEYCGRQMKGMRLLQSKCKENPAFEQFLLTAARDPRCRSFNLSGYLLKPLQRITRYPLLLKQILHYTPADHEDNAKLLEALHLSEGILTATNEAARDEETRSKMNEIIHKTDLTTGDNTLDLFSQTKILGQRRFLFEGPLQKSKSGRRLYAYLFNDLLLLAEEKRSARGYPFSMYRPPILLNRIHIDDKVSRDSTAFTIKFKTNEESIGLKSDSVTTTNNWITKLTDACAEFAMAENPRSARVSSSPQTVGTLKLIVMEGRNLNPLDRTISRLNLYCEVTVENQSERTYYIKDNPNPVWNQALMFSIRNMDETLRIVVYNQYDRYSQEDYMGTAEMGLHVLEYYGDKEIVQDFQLQNVLHGTLKVKLSYRSLMAH